YWYSITAYDRGDSLIESLESPLGKDTNAINTKSVIPRTEAIGRTPVSSDLVTYIGRGKSNYVLNVKPVDNELLSGNEYEVKFGYVPRTEIGTLRTQATITITDSSRTRPYRYGIKFKSNKTFDLINLFTGDFVRENYSYVQGGTYTVDGLRIRLADPDPNASPEFLPKAGDYITINYAVRVIRNGKDTVTPSVPFSLGKPYSTSDGIIFSLVNPEVIRNISRVGGTDNLQITFSVYDTTRLQNKTYLVSTNARGFNQKREGFVGLLIRGSAGDTVRIVDTLYNLQTFDFNGVRGKITFTTTNPPSVGNVFSLETIIPVIPNVQDAYKFTILGAKVEPKVVSSKMNNIKVVPNPYVVSSLYEIEYGELRREPLRQIQFINLPSECTIYIFTLDGDLIKTLYHNSTNGTETWDLRADGGREISTGIYLYVVKSAGSEFLNRFAVIK
ncbi:MAG: hypothetical protein N3A61_04070, partial [Ignavibacteria bacterium]|nr:hypothetical protein [Ignavibacteria bacterium]